MDSLTDAEAMMARRIRILHVVQNLNFGGMERLIAEMARRADRTRFDVHVLALGYLGHFARGLEEVAGVHLAPAQSRLSMLRPARLAATIRAIAPEVVHTHGGVWYKASLAARMAGVPYLVHTDHGRRIPDPWTFRAIDGLASRRTDTVVAVSDALAARLRVIVYHASRIRVIENGVDTDRYAPAPDDGVLRRELALEPCTPILGSVGRLEPIKGYEVMIEAFARLRAGWGDGTPPPALVLVGDGSTRPSLERLADARGCARAVHFLGWRDDVERVMHAYSLFTMSSHSEGTSVSLLEAMSSGLCPVVTDVGGNSAVLGPALHHRLVPANDPEALATAWGAALRDPVRLRADAGAARVRIVEHFGLNRMVSRYEEIYAAGMEGR